VETVGQVLKESGLEPRWLELEIPENTAAQNEEYTVMILQELKKMGVQVSLDHFGTGQASLRHLRRLQISNLKIDRSLVRNITSGQENASAISSIIALGQTLKLTVIAEGVETGEQFSFLKQQQCDEVQGYLFCKPVPAEEFKARLAGERIGIIIASDSSGYRMALKNMLTKAPGIFTVMDMGGLAEMTASAIDIQPRAVLCEVGEGEVPVTLLQKVKKDCPQTAVVLITERDDDSVAIDAVKAGADTFLRAVSPGYLSRILEIICRDDLIMFPRSFKTQIQKITTLLENLVPEPPVELNPGEREIYDLLLASIQEKG
jgi:DNA-binding NarL/FixJ family response regulator